jgi:hypothetical protein
MYIDILRPPRCAVRRKRPGKRSANSWFLLHDNAPAHRSVSANDFLVKEQYDRAEVSPILS